MSGMSIAAAGGAPQTLAVTTDPHDVHALVASLRTLAPGAYTVRWHVLSADGHRVDGSIAFSVAAGDSEVAGQPLGTAAPPAMAAAQSGAPVADAGFVAALGRRPAVAELRAAAITALLALAGLTLLIATLPISGPRPFRLAQLLAVLSGALLAAHFLVWSSTTVGSSYSLLDSISLAASTTPGGLAIARVALALLALWALLLARRAGLAALFAGVAVLITGASGHPVVTHPAISIPAKAVHLAAAAIGSAACSGSSPPSAMARDMSKARAASHRSPSGRCWWCWRQGCCRASFSCHASAP